MELAGSAYRTLFEGAPDGLAVVTPDTGRIEECNERFCEALGRERDDVLGGDVDDFLAGADVDLDTGDAGTARTWQARTDAGERITVAARLSALTVDGTERVLVRVADVTDQGGRFRERKARAVDAAPVGVTISDADRADNPLVYVNEAFERLTGYPATDALGENCRFLQGEGTDEAPVAELREAIDAEEPVTTVLRNYRKDGTAFWNRVTVAPVRDDEGAVTDFVGFQEDVTERVEGKQRLELAEHLLETVPSGVFRTDPTPDGTFEYVNPALVDLLGADSAEQLRGRRVADFYVDPAERTELVEALYEADDRRVSREVDLETLDGETRTVVVTASLARDEAGTEHVHKVVQDISDRKEREQSLERYERLVENLPIGVYRNTPGADGSFTFVNEAMVDIFGADSKTALRQRSVRDLYVDPDEREAFSEELLAAGTVTERELRLETLDGEELWGAVTAIASEVDGASAFDGVVQDITERKRYEQRITEQRDNLDLLNQVLRHDIQNNLQLVTAHAEFLSNQVGEEGRDHVETIRESAEQAVELTQTARDMADVMLSSGENHEPVGLRHVLEEELDDLRSEHASTAITVEGTIPDADVVADDMLDSVFRNLLTNAVQHNDKDIPEVRVSADERPDRVVVRVADNGPGVPDAQKETIFGKGEKGLESRGTGLGLYLVETLVDAYGGAVRVEDNDPEGAVFVVTLPKADE